MAPSSKALSGKLGSMQMLLLTAMTLLGFYLCFKEIRRIAVDTAALQDRMDACSGRPAAPPGEDAPPAEAALDGGVVMMMDDGLDDGLRQMLEQLQQAGRGAPAAADVQELDEAEDAGEMIDAAEAAYSSEALMNMTKSEIEELMRGHGVPFKKSDPKAKLVEALLEAVTASGPAAEEEEEADDQGGEAEEE